MGECSWLGSPAILSWPSIFTGGLIVSAGCIIYMDVNPKWASLIILNATVNRVFSIVSARPGWCWNHVSSAFGKTPAGEPFSPSTSIDLVRFFDPTSSSYGQTNQMVIPRKRHFPNVGAPWWNLDPLNTTDWSCVDVYSQNWAIHFDTVRGLTILLALPTNLS
jgi:hypothetical protein